MHLQVSVNLPIYLSIIVLFNIVGTPRQYIYYCKFDPHWPDSIIRGRNYVFMTYSYDFPKQLCMTTDFRYAADKLQTMIYNTTRTTKRSVITGEHRGQRIRYIQHVKAK